jgi:hypothetical protein
MSTAQHPFDALGQPLASTTHLSIPADLGQQTELSDFVTLPLSGTLPVQLAEHDSLRPALVEGAAG